MLGSFNPSEIDKDKRKSLVDAMKDSNYFERKGVEGVYEPRNTKAPVVTGSFKGDSKGFLDKFKEGALGNLEKSKNSAIASMKSMEAKKLDLRFQIQSAWKKLKVQSQALNPWKYL